MLVLVLVLVLLRWRLLLLRRRRGLRPPRAAAQGRHGAFCRASKTADRAPPPPHDGRTRKYRTPTPQVRTARVLTTETAAFESRRARRWRRRWQRAWRERRDLFARRVGHYITLRYITYITVQYIT